MDDGDENDAIGRTNIKVSAETREKIVKAMQKRAAGESFQSVADLSDAFGVPPRTINRYYRTFVATGAFAELHRGGNRLRMSVR